MTVEALLKLAERVGVPTLFAILLLWALLFRTPTTATAADVAVLSTRVEAHAKSGDSYQEKMLRFSYLMCLNTARTQSSRDACEAALR